MARAQRSKGLGAVLDRPELHELLRGLAAGEEAADRDLDRVYPEAVRKLSRTHWTPVEAARRAAQWLVTRPGAKILDVGSGAGKFCIVGALVTQGEFTGVERHAPLVAVATAVARTYRIERARFRAGDATREDCRGYDGIYLYNPFAVEIDVEAPAADARDEDAWRERTRERLATVAPGTRIVTYAGGVAMPDGLRCEWSESVGGRELEYWVTSAPQ
jgi:hypothetical protein